jgi:hypothetical protein
MQFPPQLRTVPVVIALAEKITPWSKYLLSKDFSECQPKLFVSESGQGQEMWMADQEKRMNQIKSLCFTHLNLATLVRRRD